VQINNEVVVLEAKIKICKA